MSRLKTDAIRNVNASVDGITLDTSGNVAIPNELQLADKIVHTGDTNTLIRFPSADTVSVETGGGERLRIDSSGRILVGTISHKSNLNSSADASGQLAQFVGAADNTNKCVGIFAYSGTSNPTARGAKLQLNRARSTDGSTNTALANNDLIGVIEWKGNDGTSFSSAAKIDCFVEDTSVAADHMGGRLVFSTSADGAAVPTERLRITSAGKIHSLNAVQSGGNSTGGFQFDAVDTACVLGIQQPSSASDANAAIQVFDGTSNNLRINYSGLIKTSEGIDFSGAQTNNAGMTSETLDAYEEGTWTPSLSAEAATPTTSGGFDGHYTKIGREVRAYFKITNVTVSGGSGKLQIGNLPFTTNQPLGDWAANTFGWYNHDMPSDMDGAPILYVGDNSTHASGLYFRDNNTWLGLNVDNSSGLYYKGCILYTAD